MTILHVFPIHWDRISGLTAAIPPLIAAQNALDGVDAGLLVPSRDASFDDDVGFPVLDNSLDRSSPFARPDIAVMHSTYIPWAIRSVTRLHRAGVPYILAPHGGLTRTAQRIHHLKKAAANMLFFKRFVRRAAAVQYLTENEADESRGWTSSHFVLGNGVDVPPEAGLAIPGTGDGMRFIYIGRLATHIKGLDLLVNGCSIAQSALRAARADVRLYGPDVGGSLDALQAMIDEREVSDVVRLMGPVAGEPKARALSQADAFVLTSRSEGHSMAVLEAMAHGRPCLLTPGTNAAAETEAAGAGWAIEPTPEGIARSITQAIDNRGQLAAMGANARRLATEEYAWGAIAKKSIVAYRQFISP